ncbi:nuclear transport factor 2 family protein [Actinacidiphila glaucinigra]|uniref:hypothetical protein n=1 Tax=Actinacidiphila glaucinigra TaxID=235986 RepID=UPI00366E3444
MTSTPLIPHLSVRSRGLVTAIATVALLVVTGCSGTGDQGRPPAAPVASPSTPASDATRDDRATDDDIAALEKAVRAYTTAYFAPDVDAGWAMWSTRCRKTESKGGFAGLVERAEAANVDHVRYTVERFSVERASKVLAVVTYGVGDDPRFDLTQQWVREHGGWRYDNCEPLD